VLEYESVGGGRGIPKRRTLGTKHKDHNMSPGSLVFQPEVA